MLKEKETVGKIKLNTLFFFCTGVNFWLHTITFYAGKGSEPCLLDPQAMKAERFLEVGKAIPWMGKLRLRKGSELPKILFMVRNSVRKGIEVF